MAPVLISNITTTAETLVRGFAGPAGSEDMALPIETESTKLQTLPTSAASVTSTQWVSATQLTVTSTTEEPEQDRTVAIALVVSIVAAIIVFTLAYVLYQKRRQLCGRGKRQDKAQPDLSANEVLITPVKANGGAESVPDGLVSGPRQSRPRQAVPRKWYDSAALKYMDQSTDTLDRV